MNEQIKEIKETILQAIQATKETHLQIAVQSKKPQLEIFLFREAWREAILELSKGLKDG